MLVKDGIINDSGIFYNLREKYIEKIDNDQIAVKDFGENYILPGLINCHVHLCFPGDGTSAEDFMSRNQDEVISITAAKNAPFFLKKPKRIPLKKISSATGAIIPPAIK